MATAFICCCLFARVRGARDPLENLCEKFRDKESG